MNLKPYTKLIVHGPKLEGKITLAFSGGIDSLAVLDYLSRSRVELDLLYINHSTEHGNASVPRIREIAEQYNKRLRIETLPPTPVKGSSECWWRERRYEFFHAIENPVITCHHLDDCVETWIWSCMHGKPGVIPYRHKNVIRPFRTCKKGAFNFWLQNHSLVKDHIEDPSNTDEKYTRNYIRHTAIPILSKVNPGLDKVVRKMIMNETQKDW